MPCYDGGWDSTSISSQERDKLRRCEALLCAVFSTYNIDEILPNLDLTEAGVTKEWVLAWWVAHQEADRKRRLREKRYKRESLKRLKKKMLDAKKEYLKLKKELEE